MAKRPKGEAKGKATVQLPATLRTLTDAELAELRAFGERLKQRPPVPRFKADGTNISDADGVDPDLFRARIAAAVGSVDPRAINSLLNQAAETVAGDDAAQKGNAALTLLAGIQPRNEVEGMLSVQMVGCHNLAMAMLRRATKTERVQFLAVYANLASKLLRTFTAQTEALARLRGQTGQQVVRVEHVTVEAGGQAIVGAVTTRGRGCEPKPTDDPLRRDGAGD